MDQGVASAVRSIEHIEQLLLKECKRTDADASEFLSSLAFCLNVLRGGPKIAANELDQLIQTIEKYKTAVSRAITGNDIKRVVTQTRLVAILETTNYRLLSLVQPAVAVMGGQFTSFQTQVAAERETREWWTLNFPTYPMQVPWELFLSAFTSYLGALTPQQLLFPSDVAFLRYLLDCNNINHVGLWKYAELIRLFGHPPQLLGKLRELATAKWFHGFASSSEAEKMLSLSTPGTFLLRFSKAKASAVAIAFKEGPTAYKHTVVSTTAGKYVIDGQKYRSLSHLVLAYAHLLSTPLENSLLRDPSFFGDISGSEAQELMNGRRMGEYLWRFSSRARFLSLTFVASESPTQVRHVLVEELQGGTYRVETDTVTHPTLAAVVAALTALPLRTAMLHTVWTLPNPSSSFAPFNSPLPSPFRNLNDYRAGSYKDFEENGGAQPVSPMPLRVPSPLPQPDNSNDPQRRSNNTSPRAAGSDAGKPVISQLRTGQIVKPNTPSPPSPGKQQLADSTRKLKDGYSFMPPISAATAAISQQPATRKDEISPSSNEWRLRPVQHAEPGGGAWEVMPALGGSVHYEPLDAQLPYASAAIAVPGASSSVPSSAGPASLPSSASSDSSGGLSSSASPQAARWEGAAPRKDSMRANQSVKRGALSVVAMANSPPRLVLPQRGTSNEVVWVPMPPLDKPLDKSNSGDNKPFRQPAMSVGAWRAIKPSGAQPSPPTDVALAKATFANSAANASFPSKNAPAPVPLSASESHDGR